MTLIGLNPKKCAVCGHEGKFPVMHSYTIFENSDLDGRPGEMLRGTMWTWVERCLNCNYCGRRIEHVEDERFTQMVYEASYQQLLSIPGQVAPPVRLCDTAIPLERYHHSGK